MADPYFRVRKIIVSITTTPQNSQGTENFCQCLYLLKQSKFLSLYTEQKFDSMFINFRKEKYLIAKGIPAGKQVSGLGNARQGIGYGFHRYAGPKPPKGSIHTYRFRIYSLDCEIDLSANSRKKDFLKKAENHILQIGSIAGKFE